MPPRPPAGQTLGVRVSVDSGPVGMSASAAGVSDKWRPLSSIAFPRPQVTGSAPKKDVAGRFYENVPVWGVCAPAPAPRPGFWLTQEYPPLRESAPKRPERTTILPLGKLQLAGLGPEPAPQDRSGRWEGTRILRWWVPVSSTAAWVSLGEVTVTPRPRPTESGALGHRGGHPQAFGAPFWGPVHLGRPHIPPPWGSPWPEASRRGTPACCLG